MKKNYVQIHSSITINVTGGLEYLNLTNPKLINVKDSLKISPQWPKSTITIKEGQHYYPSEVADYKTVKKLVSLGKLTISQFYEELPEDMNGVEKDEVKMQKNKLERVKNEYLEKLKRLNKTETKDKVETKEVTNGD